MPSLKEAQRSVLCKVKYKEKNGSGYPASRTIKVPIDFWDKFTQEDRDNYMQRRFKGKIATYRKP